MQKTKDIELVKKVLGHTKSDMTRRYAHLLDTTVFDELEKVQQTETPVGTGELFIHYGRSNDFGMLVKERGDEVLIALDEILPMVKEEVRQYIQP